MILDQAFAKSTDNISERASSRTTRAAAAPPDPLDPQWWKNELKPFKDAASRASDKDYFTKFYREGKDTSTPGPDPLNIRGKADELAGKAEKVQICMYRCMALKEAKSITIDLTGKTARPPCYLLLSQLTGHIGHHKQAKDICSKKPTEGKHLVEFLLKPNAHELLFSPEVAALGSTARKNAYIAETAKQKKLGVYVVKGLGGKPGTGGEGFVDGFIGIKPEGEYYSLAMQANKRTVRDSNTKKLFAELTKSVRVIDTNTPEDDLCDLNPPLAPTEPPVAPTEPPVAPTEPPVAPTAPPVAPTAPPVAPTEPPVAPEA